MNNTQGAKVVCKLQQKTYGVCEDAVNEFAAPLGPLFFSLICVFSVLSTPCSTKWTLWPPVIFQPFEAALKLQFRTVGPRWSPLLGKILECVP